MKTKRQTILFQVISWVIAYVILGIIIYIFDEAQADLQKLESKSDLFFILRFNMIAGIIVRFAFATILTLGVVPVLYSLFYKVRYKGNDFEKDIQLSSRQI